MRITFVSDLLTFNGGTGWGWFKGMKMRFFLSDLREFGHATEFTPLRWSIVKKSLAVSY
jgi:hypothetical protein